MALANLNDRIEQWLQLRQSSFQVQSRPFITLSYAQSLDGSITTRRGEAFNLSGSESMELTHQLRSLHQGILVGIDTLISDNPQLTVREWSGSNPQPVVLDSQLRIPNTAKICHHPDKTCWVLTLKAESDVINTAVEVLTVPPSSRDHLRVSLEASMRLLREKGIESLMIEGGAEIITAFLRAELVDAVVLTIAPCFVGGYKAIGDLQSKTHHFHGHVKSMHSEHAGEDLIVWGDVNFEISPT